MTEPINEPEPVDPGHDPGVDPPPVGGILAEATLLTALMNSTSQSARR